VKLDSSIAINKIVDIEWKILHNVASKHLMRVNKDLYLINLKYITPEAELKTTTFKCNYEELVSLVESLNIACNSIAKTCENNELIAKSG
jgi:hypothetical protein